MKKLLLAGFVFFLYILSLGGCVKNQDDSTSAATAPTNQNINDTNYQEMLREQSARAQQVEDANSHPHVGGRR